MNSVDPEYRAIVDGLRNAGHYSGKPPLPPETKSGNSDPVKADWEPRVNRLELGFCGGMVLIFTAIIASYLMLGGKIDSASDKAAVSAGDVRVLNERTSTMDKKIDRIESKLDAISVKLDHK